MGSLPTPCYEKGVKRGAIASASGSEAPKSERTLQLRLPVLLAVRQSSCGVSTMEGNNPSSVLRSWLETGGSVVCDKPFSNPGDPSDRLPGSSSTVERCCVKCEIVLEP